MSNVSIWLDAMVFSKTLFSTLHVPLK